MQNPYLWIQSKKNILTYMLIIGNTNPLYAKKIRAKLDQNATTRV